ncbi:MAG: hypothetical protein ACQKBU_03815 [Verrucomicrobiales bacterium]
MRTNPLLFVLILSSSLQAAPPRAVAGVEGKWAGLRGGRTAALAEVLAMREEEMVDQLDTQRWKEDEAALDQRPERLGEYVDRVYQRIVRLLHHGAITETDGLVFKMKHTEIVTAGKAMRLEGPLSEEQTEEIRARLDALGDEMNAVLEASENAARSPVLHQTQERLEQQIEFGVRSGRLSSSESNRLKRDLERLSELEESLDGGGLTTREREKLFEEAEEIALEIREELLD